MSLIYCFCDLHGSRDFGFVGLSQCREHFLFIMLCMSLMEGLTKNKGWRKPQADAKPFRGMVSILVLNKNVGVVFVSLHAVEV